MRTWILGGILVLAFLLRFIGITEHPIGFTPDEASFGYDAYSLLQTGKDQWGNAWPLTFKSFGDYKLPLYTYLALPSVAIFGLSEFAVRFPNVIVGTLSVAATYLLLKERNWKLALLVALLLALSPWHIPMSRGAFEANLTTFLLPLGIWAFIKGNKNNLYYYIASLAFGLNMFTYHSARLVTPLIVGVLLVIYKPKFNRNIHFIIAAAALIVFALIAALTLLGGGGTRASTSTIFSEAGYSGAFTNRYESVLAGLHPVIATIFNNKVALILNEFIQKYVSYFSIPFFWTEGPAEATYGMMPGFGVLYWFESIFLLFFVIYLFKNKLNKNNIWLVAWLLLAPIPAALSIGPGFAANRAAIMMPAIHIASALGAAFGYGLIKKYVSFRTAFAAFLLTLLISSLFFLEEYFYQQPVDGGPAMFYGVKEAMGQLGHSGSSNIIVSKRLSEPQIFVAFYHKIDPVEFQKQSQDWKFKDAGFNWVDQLPEYSLGKYAFKNIHLDSSMELEGAYLLVPEEYKEGVNASVINYPSGKPAYYIVK